MSNAELQRTAGPAARSGHRPTAALDLAPARTEFRMLGPLQVVDRGAPVTVSGQKRRALLARLLLDANRTVPVEALVDALWGDEAPATAVKMVHVHVSQLRKALPDEMLHTRPPGYRLHVTPEALDLPRFTRLRDAGRAALAGGDAVRGAELLRTALELWRGPALAEFSEPFAVVEAAHLEELRLATVEDRVEGDLARGLHAELVGELRALVGSHPLRTRLRCALMLALYRAGRHADALGAYQDYRRTLRDQLGAEPPAAARELQYRILNQDPALEPERAAAAGPATAAPATAPDGLAGRRDELRRLEHALEAAGGGRGTTLLLAGAAGIGKTRLAGELVERARSRGATVLRGACVDRVGAVLPHHSLAEALRPLRACSALDGQDQLRRLLSGTAQAPGERLLEELLAVLERLSATAPVVLVLEDLHWADPSTVELLPRLARAVRTRRVLLLATARTDGAGADDALRRLAERLGPAGVVELGPLAGADLEALVAQGAAPSLPAAQRDAVCARSEGNPFLARELMAAALDGDRLPRRARDVALRGFAGLDAHSRALVRVAAAAGRGVSHGLLAAAAGCTDEEALAALRQAVGRGVLVPDERAGTYRFRHALIAEAVYDTLLPGEREEVHGRLAAALDRDPSLAGSPPSAAEVAAHRAAASGPAVAARHAAGR